MRVQLKTKNKGVKKATYPCRKCSEPIKAGEKYYEWHPRNAGPQRQHAQHGGPKQSDLCQGRMSEVYAQTESLDDIIAACRTGNDISTLADELNSAADEIDNIKDEYQQGLDAMPDQLQYSSSGEQIQEKIDALEELAEALRSAASDVETAQEEIGDEPDAAVIDHASDCPENPDYTPDEENADAADEEIECNCGKAEAEEKYDEWETERDNKVNEACDAAESAVQSLSI